MSALRAVLAVDRGRRLAWEEGLELDDVEVVAEPHDAARIVAATRAERPDVVVCSASRRCLDAEVVRTCDSLAVRLVVLVGGEADRRRAAALGLYEVASARAGWEEIRALAVGPPAVAHRAARTRGARSAGLIAVWGPAGAPGRSTLAVSLAAELAARGDRVVLVDADTYGGSIAPLLGLLDESPGFAAACRLAGSDALSTSELDRLATHHASAAGSFRVLTGITRPTRWPELSSERVTAALEAVRRVSDAVVVDVGFSLESDEEISSDLFAPRRNAATLAALRAAEHVVALGTADPVGLARLIRGHAELVELVPDAEVDVVVNRVRASVAGPNPYGQVRATLSRFAGIDRPVLVPEDRAAFDAAVATASTLRDAAPRSAARAAIARLAATFPAAGDDPLPGAAAPEEPDRSLGALRPRGRRRRSAPPRRTA